MTLTPVPNMVVSWSDIADVRFCCAPFSFGVLLRFILMFFSPCDEGLVPESSAIAGVTWVSEFCLDLLYSQLSSDNCLCDLLLYK